MKRLSSLTMDQPQGLRTHLGGGRLHIRSSPFDGWSVHPALLLLVLLLSFNRPSCPAFIPADNYLVNCGATTTADGGGGRSFLPDVASSSARSSNISFHLDGSAILTNPNPSSAPARYLTARSFTRNSSYNFRISSINSTLVVRLHFHPSFTNLSSSAFSISAYASGVTLLSRFTFEDRSAPIIKEFFLNPRLDSLKLSFSPDPSDSFAFVNAIELFSAPTRLLQQTVAVTVLTAAGGLQTLELDHQVLETLHRINIGGPMVSPDTDTLWRTWLPDDAVYVSKSRGAAVKNAVHYAEGGATREHAPETVYGTARAMNNTSIRNRGGNGGVGIQFNLSWAVKVDSGGLPQFLVRMHYCDIVSESLNDEFQIKSYINNQVANEDLDISSKTYPQLAAPYFEDFVVGTDGPGILRVAVGPVSNKSMINALLNGLEVWAMKGPVNFKSDNPKGIHDVVIGGATVGGALVLLGAVAAITFMLRRMKKDKNKKPPTASPGGFPPSAWPSITDIGTEKGSRWSDGTPLRMHLELRIAYEVILAATNSFDKEVEIGSGGFGKVYKGKLPDGQVVAVKRGIPGSQHGPKQFESEILILSKTRHRHLVSFIGFCDERGEMILVYEFMEKGTLQSHLYGGSNNPCLSWKRRLQILIGAAQGLDYLHTGQEPGIIHRDVKSANILLDGRYDAKVADFGISKLGPTDNSSSPSSASKTGTSAVKGTFGYLDPEYFQTQQFTSKSDVYSFGVVLLEVACARAALLKTLPDEEINLAEWGLKWIELGMFIQIVDPRITGEIDPNSLRVFSTITEKCLTAHGDDRPTMRDVVWNLNYALTLQETSLRSEAHEDSVVGSSVANVSVVRSIAAANPKIMQENGPWSITRTQSSDLSSIQQEQCVLSVDDR